MHICSYILALSNNINVCGNQVNVCFALGVATNGFVFVCVVSLVTNLKCLMHI